MRIDDELLADAKALAARQHRSLNAIFEEALRELLGHPRAIDLPPATFTTYAGGAGGPDVGELDADALKEVMYGEEIARHLDGHGNVAG